MILAVGVALGTWVLAAVDRLLGRRPPSTDAPPRRLAMRPRHEAADQPSSADARRPAR